MATEKAWQVVREEKSDSFTEPFVLPEKFAQTHGVVIRQMQHTQSPRPSFPSQPQLPG